MKNVIIMYEGVADAPLDVFGGRTPLQVTRCPHASRLAREGRQGLLTPVREGLEGRNEVSLAVLLGMPAKEARKLRRGPIEAAGLERGAEGYSFAYAANFVTRDGEWLRDGRVKGLSFEETRSLAAVLDQRWKPRRIAVRPVGPGRAVVLCEGKEDALAPGDPPCLVEGEKLKASLPAGSGWSFIREILEESAYVLQGQTVNDVRVDLGEDPANGLWLWGGGAVAETAAVFAERPVAGVMLTQSPLARGLGRLCGMSVLEMEDPWAPGREAAAFRTAALASALAERDFLMVYVEAPRKMGHYGTAVEKVKAIELLDQFVLGPLLDVLDGLAAYRVVLASDGVGSTEAGRPISGRNPMVLAGDGLSADRTEHWDEEEAARGSLGLVRAASVMKLLQRGV